MKNSSNSINKQIFTDEFEQVSVDEIINQIKLNGYFSFEKAISNEALNEIEKMATESMLNFNQNNISGVYKEKQYFFTNLLTVSKSFYDFVTSKFVLDICEKYMGNSFRLTALRYYETYGKHHMQWHTDNKTDKEFSKFPGLIFICYLSDVNDGQFQYIKRSHLWSSKKNFNDYSDEFIEQSHKQEIENFKYPRGSIIIYNTHGIHRAKPVMNNNFIRKSIFFQVDNITNNSEPILLNTSFIDKIDDKISMFLGFGRPANYKIFPKTSLNTLPLSKDFIVKIVKYAPYRLIRGLFNFSPNFIKKFLRDFVKKNK